ETLRGEVPRFALATRFRQTTVQNIAREVLQIARKGLQNRRQINAAGQDETVHLDALEEVVDSRRTLADELLERFEGPWRENIDHVFEEYAL
ncbi:MAG: glutamate--cysteine ligase, partial [Hyphomicrobiaceae bacterium]